MLVLAAAKARAEAGSGIHFHTQSINIFSLPLEKGEGAGGGFLTFSPFVANATNMYYIQAMTKSSKAIAQWTPDETAAWTGLVRSSQNLLQSVEAALKDNDLPSLGWYDVLWELEKARPRGLRLNDLGSRVLLDKYNVTRLVTRLEKEGLARRMNCPGDGRGIVALITPKGSRLRKRMWPVYSCAVREEFFSRLSRGEIASLRKVLARVLNAPSTAPARKPAKSV